MRYVLQKLGVAVPTSVILTESLNLDVLYNALITLAVSVLSVLAVEGVNWLKNYIISKTVKVKNNDSKVVEKEE